MKNAKQSEQKIPDDIYGMTRSILKLLNDKYEEYNTDDCLDMIQLCNLCNLYQTKETTKNSQKKRETYSSISLTDMTFSSPSFQKDKRRSKNLDVLKTQEFQKRYIWLIRMIYVCLKIDVDILNESEDTATIKTNYQLLKTFETKKKQLLREHIEIMKKHLGKINNPVYEAEYEEYYSSFRVNIKILDKITADLNKVIDANILDKTDTIMSLILPYFYTYAEYIEEYN